MTIYPTKSTAAALAIVALLPCFIANPTIAAPRVMELSLSGPPGERGVVRYGDRLVRPLYSEQCLYKAVMTEEDMRRCGIGVGREPPPRVAVLGVSAERSVRLPARADRN